MRSMSSLDVDSDPPNGGTITIWVRHYCRARAESSIVCSSVKFKIDDVANGCELLCSHFRVVTGDSERACPVTGLQPSYHNES